MDIFLPAPAAVIRATWFRNVLSIISMILLMNSPLHYQSRKILKAGSTTFFDIVIFAQWNLFTLSHTFKKVKFLKVK